MKKIFPSLGTVCVKLVGGLVYASRDPNICFRTFLLIFCALFNKCFPIETKVIKTKSFRSVFVMFWLRSHIPIEVVL